MKKIMYAALIASTLPVAAMAGGMAVPVIEPVLQMPVAVLAAPSVDWTGLYAGASLGYGKLNLSGNNNDSKEGIAGVHLGYRKDFGTLVAGGQLALTKNDIGIDGNDNQINSEAALGLSLGADIGRTLVYVSGGATRASARLNGTTGEDNGYFAGIGADYMLTDKFTVGGELKSTKYGNFDGTGINLQDTTLQVKVGMRF